MADFLLFPLRFLGSLTGLFSAFGIVGTVRRIRNGSVKFAAQGVAAYRADIDTASKK